MISIPYNLSNKEFNSLDQENPNNGKNSHIGNKAVEIVKLYFRSVNKNISFEVNGSHGVDLKVITSEKTHEYEIKGTADPNIAFGKIKVSSQACFDKLAEGMTLIRVCNIGKRNVTLHFLQYGVDFDMKPEPRWSVKKLITSLK